MNRPAPAAPPAWKVAAAFAAVYLIWGSTYYAIARAVETIPPFLMSGARYVTAGGLLFAWSRLRGAPAPTARHWRSALGVGTLMLLGGNGVLAWAERTVPSGVASLLIAFVPVWMALIDRFRPGSRARDGALWWDLALGLAGVGLLVLPGRTGGPVSAVGAAALLGAGLSWAAGSLWSREAPLPADPLLATGLQMLAGGAALLTASGIAGEWRGFRLADVSAASAWGWLYLVVFGALVGFTCYLWILRVSTPAKVSTYAYVNPVVAVFLGWALGGEALGPRTLAGGAVIVASVALITLRGRTAPPARSPADPGD